MIFILVALLLDITQSKLLRINEWHNLEVSPNGKSDDDIGAIIDLHLFATCERFSIVFMTEHEEFTRFRFKFDDLVLKKIDIESVFEAPIPKPPKLIGSCRSNSRKLLRINVKTTNQSIIFQIADQVIRRPFDLPNFKDLKVLIPQNVSCCLIRALYLSNFDRHNLGEEPSFASRPTTKDYRSENEIDNRVLERVSPRLRVVVADSATTRVSAAPEAVSKFPYIAARIVVKTSTTAPAPEGTTPSGSLSSPASDGPNPWSKFTIGENPESTSTALPRSAISWTHAVNKEWSTTFIFCSVLISIIMLFLIVFGTFVVFYLITKPKGGKSPYAIDA